MSARFESCTESTDLLWAKITIHWKCFTTHSLPSANDWRNTESTSFDWTISLLVVTIPVTQHNPLKQLLPDVSQDPLNRFEPKITDSGYEAVVVSKWGRTLNWVTTAETGVATIGKLSCPSSKPFSSSFRRNNIWGSVEVVNLMNRVLTASISMSWPQELIKSQFWILQHSFKA